MRKLCFPVASNEGLESRAFGHFGSAPAFLVVDSESGAVAEVINRDLHHAHGACSPVRALGGHAVNAVVVGGIGGGALTGLTRAGIHVLEARAQTVRENVALHGRGALVPWGPGRTCGRHRHGYGCTWRCRAVREDLLLLERNGRKPPARSAPSFDIPRLARPPTLAQNPPPLSAAVGARGRESEEIRRLDAIRTAPGRRAITRGFAVSWHNGSG